MEESGSIAGLIFSIVYFLVIIAIVVFLCVAWWKIFEKAGKPGWASLIPIYNIIVMLEIVGKPITWLFLALCLGPVFQILFSMELAERFGQERTWGIIWLWLIAPVGLYKLAFTDEMTYTPPPGA